MIQRLWATLVKECQLLWRDRKGLVVLFVLPILLVFIMTLIQHEAYRSLNETGVPVLLINDDNGVLGQTIQRAFEDFELCSVTVYNDEQSSVKSSYVDLVASGEYVVAVHVPENATSVLRQDVKLIMDAITEDEKLDSTLLKQVEIEIVADPIARKSFIMAIGSGLREFIASVKTRILFEMMSTELNEISGNQNKLTFPAQDFFIFNEYYAVSGEDDVFAPNAVQHNIPAWAIFSIFFIIIPLGASIIKERENGLITRLRTLPGNYFSILSGKLLLFTIIGCIQMAIIVCIGLYILPQLGLPRLQLGSNLGAFTLLTIIVAISAVAYGLFLGTFFNSAPQASIFGGISVLIFSALGGIWVPLNIMPDIMQSISIVSPLNWSLKGFYALMIQNAGLSDILYCILMMLLFTAVMVCTSWFINVNRCLRA